jgi:hypothetical protein
VNVSAGIYALLDALTKETNVVCSICETEIKWKYMYIYAAHRLSIEEKSAVKYVSTICGKYVLSRVKKT